MKVDIDCNFKIPDVFLASAGTVNDLKEKIENYVGIKMEQQILRVKGKNCLNSKTMDLILVA